jgi:hypothetical protein
LGFGGVVNGFERFRVCFWLLPAHLAFLSFYFDGSIAGQGFFGFLGGCC